MRALEPIRTNRCMACLVEDYPLEMKLCPVCGGKLLLFTNPPSAEQRLERLEEKMDILEQRGSR